MTDRFDRYSHALARVIVIGMLPFAVGRCVAEPIGAMPSARATHASHQAQFHGLGHTVSVTIAGDAL